jgi:hypothetical protein
VNVREKAVGIIGAAKMRALEEAGIKVDWAYPGAWRKPTGRKIYDVWFERPNGNRGAVNINGAWTEEEAIERAKKAIGVHPEDKIISVNCVGYEMG